MSARKRTATIILNRNLPEVTDRLWESLHATSGEATDIYVVESGSAPDKRSKHCSFVADWPESVADGLRYARGFNFGLASLLEAGLYERYDYFFMVCNDAVFEGSEVVQKLERLLDRHRRVGILSPCADDWGERKLLAHDGIKYFWYVNHIAWMVRRELVDAIRELDHPTYLNFLYDGSNFRGYESDIELIVKAYANDFAAAITREVRIRENQALLVTDFKAMRTDDFETNRVKVFEEGQRWLRRKYGFNSRWSMQLYAKFWYEKFFEFYPQLRQYSILGDETP